MLYIDTREKGRLHSMIAKQITKHEYKALDAGDYVITKPDGLVVIERTTYSDLVGKITSGRLWIQKEKCLSISDDVYFILENPSMLKYSKIHINAVYGVILSLSRNCKVITTRNDYETGIAIKVLHEKFNAERQLEIGESRAKITPKSYEDLAKYCIMGINGVGNAIATKALEKKSISELANMEVAELSKYVPMKVAVRMHGVFHS